jgi:hypothetical protein
MGEAEREEVGTRERSFGEAQGALAKRKWLSTDVSTYCLKCAARSVNWDLSIRGQMCIHRCYGGRIVW